MNNKYYLNHKLKTKISSFPKAFGFLTLICIIFFAQGCVSDKVNRKINLVKYQETLTAHEARKGLVYKDPNQALEILKPPVKVIRLN